MTDLTPTGLRALRLEPEELERGGTGEAGEAGERAALSDRVPDPVPALTLAPATIGDHLITAGLWGVGLTFLASCLGTMGVLSSFVPPDRTEWLNRFYCKWQIKLSLNQWRAVVHPAVDPARSYLFAQNHTNHLDHTVLYNATPHFKQGLELESHFSYPFYGWFMKARGTIPVRPAREGQTPEIMAHMRAEVAKGHSILAFPEGTRTPDGRVGPLRKGTFFIARDLGLPIVPVAVTGSYDVMRKGSLRYRAGNTITVYVEEPIETAGLRDEEIPALAERVHRALSSRVDAYWRQKARERRGR